MVGGRPGLHATSAALGRAGGWLGIGVGGTAARYLGAAGALVLLLALLMAAGGRTVIVPDLLDFDFSFSRSARLRAVSQTGSKPLDLTGHAGHLRMCDYPAATVQLLEVILAEAGVPALDLLGHSFGGWLAHRIAEGAAEGALVRRVVLVCPGGLGRYRIIPSAAPLAGLAATRTMVPPHMPRGVGELAARVFQLIARSPWTVHFVSSMAYEEYFAPPASAHAVTQPALLLWGDCDTLHRVMPDRPGTAMLYGLQRGTGYWLVGGGHALPIDSVVVVARLASEFLGEGGRGGGGSPSSHVQQQQQQQQKPVVAPWRLRVAAAVLARLSVACGADRHAVPMVPVAMGSGAAVKASGGKVMDPLLRARL